MSVRSFPWIVVGTAVGMMVGFVVMPAEARIGLPVHYAAIPVAGAIVGAASGAIIEAAIRRRSNL